MKPRLRFPQVPGLGVSCQRVRNATFRNAPENITTNHATINAKYHRQPRPAQNMRPAVIPTKMPTLVHAAPTKPLLTPGENKLASRPAVGFFKGPFARSETVLRGWSFEPTGAR